MNASTSALFAALTALAIVGCSSRTSSTPTPTPTTSNESAGLAGQCSGKACGSDCSPPGSDEDPQFRCNATAHCVPANEDLACKTCPEFLGDCRQGDVPADLDGDGCIDGCKAGPCAGKACGVDCSPAGSDEPFNCNAAGACVAVGTELSCHCPPFVGDCKQGDVPADLNGDGCIDGCKTP